MRFTSWLGELRDDGRFALRQLRRSPGFTLVAALTLALGIGANSAIFALVDATLLRPLPFREPDRLVMLWERSATPNSTGSTRSRVSPPNLIDWNERSRTFTQIAGFVPSVGGMVMNGLDGRAETVSRQWVSAGFFDVLGVTPIAGRTFTQADNDQRANVVVLSEAFWRVRFAGDRGIVGQAIRLDGEPYTVAGIVPQSFQWRGQTSMWALISIDRRAPRRARMFETIGRMKPDATIDAARGDLSAVATGLAREFPDSNKGRGVTIEPLQDALVGSELRLTSMLFLGVVGVVLLICCANVANLLLARATVRSRELAVRAALGASRARVIRQLLTESLVLAAIGGVLGAGVGAAILNVAPAVIPEGLIPTQVTLSFDARVVIFCAAAALIVGVLFGVAPAWQATDISSAQVMGADSRTTTGRGGRLRSVLIVGEVATAVLLLFGAGLLLRTLIAVDTVDRGYRADRVLTMLVDPLGDRYPTATALLQFFDAIEHEVAAQPGVRSVAWATMLPLGQNDGGLFSFDIAGDPPVEQAQRPTTEYQIVSPGYFGTLDIPIVAGRAFTARDTKDNVQVCVVNEAFVRTHLRGRSPVGLRVALRPSSNPQAEARVKEIVGVVHQVKSRPDEAQDVVQIYVPLAQDPIDDMFMVVAPAGDRSAESLVSSVRGAIAKVDTEQLVSVREVVTLENIAREATGRHRFRAVLVVTFAGLALLLSMVGVFGILAYSVQQRMRDVAVRRALGATTRDILNLVALDAVRVVGAGAILGLALSAALGRLLTTMLFGVEAWDPATFASVTIVLLVTAAISIAGPALRATRIDPAVALRGK